MSTPTEVQIIKRDGKPVFAVLPYEQYLELVKRQTNDEVYIPHEVVGLCIQKGLSLLAAWRSYKSLSQAELAASMGVSQPAVAQMEKQGSSPRRRTLQKAATALGISVEQLVDQNKD